MNELCSLKKLFGGRDALTFKTGNINAWKELKQHQFSNPSDELIGCLKFQLSSGNLDVVPVPGVCDSETTEDGERNSGVRKTSAITDNVMESYGRDELKVTFKLFLCDWPAGSDIVAAVQEMLSALSVQSAELLILSCPPEEPDEDGDSDEENASERPKELPERLKHVWTSLENLVDEGKALNIGVADFELSDLKRLFEWARVKPTVNHYNIAACCTVPPELSAYAKANNIQLLTHNDPRDFFPQQKFQDILVQNIHFEQTEAAQWKVKWVLRDAIMIKCRSVIMHKGYLLHIHKEVAN